LDLPRQRFEVIKASTFSVAILIRHALNAFGLDQYGFVLASPICFFLKKLALFIHTLSVTLKAKLDSPYFANFLATLRRLCTADCDRPSAGDPQFLTGELFRWTNWEFIGTADQINSRACFRIRFGVPPSGGLGAGPPKGGDSEPHTPTPKSVFLRHTLRAVHCI